MPIEAMISQHPGVRGVFSEAPGLAARKATYGSANRTSSAGPCWLTLEVQNVEWHAKA